MGVLNINDHLLVNVGVPHYLTELLKTDLAIVVPVSKQNRLVHDLLQLCILQVIPHHHLQNLEKFSVGDVAVVIYVVYSEGESEFAIFVSFDTKLRHSLNELLEVHLTVAVIVENLYNSLHQWILLELRQGHELVHTQRPRVVQIKFLEPLPKSLDLFCVEGCAHVKG